MRRQDKVKDAKRRARKQERKAIHAFGYAFTERLVPDKKKQQKLRRKPKHRKPLNED